MRKGFILFTILMVLSLIIAGLWNQIPAIKNFIHALLDPYLPALFEGNPTVGMAILTAFIALILTLLQKYTVDQTALKDLKAQQKALQKEIQDNKDNPQKSAELMKKQFTEITPKMFELSLQPSFYTIIPLILLFRWFMDYFAANPTTFFGFMSWFWAYLVLSIVFSMIFRKLFRLD